MNRLAPVVALCASVSVLAACGGTPPTAAQRKAATYDSISGAAPDEPGPRGITSSMPPGDLSANPLRCRNIGPETVCNRDP